MLAATMCGFAFVAAGVFVAVTSGDARTGTVLVAAGLAIEGLVLLVGGRTS